MPLQIPPAVGSSGQFVETVIVTSSQQRHVMALGDAASTAYGPLTSSGGLLVAVSNPSTAVTFTNAPTTSVTVTNISTAVTVTNPSTAVTVTNPSTQVNTLSSGPILISGTVPVVSASSGLVQISGTPTVVSASSGLVQISGTSLILSASSGLVQTLSSGPITGTVNTLSSGAILLSSAGITQVLVAGTSGGFALVTSQGSIQVITTASAAGSTAVSVFGFGTVSTATQTQVLVTSSGALLVSGTPGSVSTAVNLLTSGGAFYPATTSKGLVVNQAYSTVPFRLTIASSIGKISTGAGTLLFLSAFTTAPTIANWLRLYNLTTNNATSSSQMGSTGATAMFNIQSSVATRQMGVPSPVLPIQGVHFDTACSFDIVTTATSTGGGTIQGWVTSIFAT